MGECVTRNSCHSTLEKQGELETERSSTLQNVRSLPSSQTAKPNRVVLCCAESNTAPVWAGEATKQLFQLCSACSNQRTAYSNMWPDQLSHRANQLQHNNSRQRPSCCRYSFSLPYFQALISRLPQESSCLFVPAVLNSGSLRWDWCDQTQKRLGYG